MATIIRTLRPIESYGCSFPSPGTLASVPDAAAAALIAAGLAEALESEVSDSLYTAHSILKADTAGSPAPLTVPEGTLLGRATGGDVAALTAAQVSVLLGNPLSDLLTTGEASINRRVPMTNVSAVAGGGYVYFTYFTAAKTETVTKLALSVGSTAAAATPSLCRMGVYSVADNGDLALVASCANDTTLFAAANTRYERATEAPWAKVAGRRYAAAVIVSSAGATPTLLGIEGAASGAAVGTMFGTSPRLSGYVVGADLGASYAAGDVANTTRRVYMEMLP